MNHILFSFRFQLRILCIDGIMEIKFLSLLSQGEKIFAQTIHLLCGNLLLRNLFSRKGEFYSMPTGNVLNQQNNFRETVKRVK